MCLRTQMCILPKKKKKKVPNHGWKKFKSQVRKSKLWTVINRKVMEDIELISLLDMHYRDLSYWIFYSEE